MRAPLLTFTWLALTTSLVACGGGTPEAESPASAESESPPASDEKAEAESSESAEEDSEDSEKGDKADKSGEKDEKDEKPAEEAKPTKTAKDVVSRPDVLYMFSFAASEPYQEAEKKCTASAKDDPKKKADCMSKASSKFESDGMAFMLREEKWWWLTVARRGKGGLVTLHKFEFEWGEDGEKQVTIKPKGPDKGTKPKGGAPKELVVEVVSDSEIAVKDPKLGRLVYEAKLGLMGDQER